MKDPSQDGTGPAADMAPGLGQSVRQLQQQQGQTQLGTLVLRLINIGQEPRHTASMSDTSLSAAPGTPGKKVRLYACEAAAEGSRLLWHVFQ